MCQQRASQIHSNDGQHQFVTQLVAETMIGEQEINRALKGMNHSLPINMSDYGKKILKIQRALNIAAWSKAPSPLLDGGKGEHSVNIKFHWERRRRPRRHVSEVEYAGIPTVWLQTRQEPVWKVRGAKEIEKASNKCLPDAVLTAPAKVKSPGKGINVAG